MGHRAHCVVTSQVNLNCLFSLIKQCNHVIYVSQADIDYLHTPDT